MKFKKLSVVMPVYNAEKYLQQSITSILNQTFKEFELIIVDDGSTDSSLRLVKTIKDKRIIILKNKQNLGLTPSLNKGVKKSTGKYVARADGDDIYDLNRFHYQINFLEKNPSYVLVGSNADLIDENNKKIGELIFPSKDLSLRKKIIIRNVIIHPSVMIRTEAIKKAGLYKQLFNLGSEEYDLWFRMMSLGKIYNLPKKLMKRRIYDDAYSMKNHFRVEIMGLIVRFINLPRYVYNLAKFFPLLKDKVFL